MSCCADTYLSTFIIRMVVYSAQNQRQNSHTSLANGFARCLVSVTSVDPNPSLPPCHHAITVIVRRIYKVTASNKRIPLLFLSNHHPGSTQTADHDELKLNRDHCHANQSSIRISPRIDYKTCCTHTRTYILQHGCETREAHRGREKAFLQQESGLPEMCAVYFLWR